MLFFNVNNLIFFIGFITICLCDDDEPKIVSITPEQVADIGGTVELVCKTSNADTLPIIWNKKYRDRPTDSIVLAVNNLLAIRDNRYEVIHQETEETSTLKIKDIHPLDSGIYECQIVVSNKKSTLQVELFVRQPPIINENATTLLITAAENQTVKLTCVAEGFPRPDIIWKREYNAILPGGGNSLHGNTLKIFSVKKEDRGVYLCNADNGVGVGDSKIINLEVEFPPIISVPRPKTAQAQFYDIDLHCNVAAFPSPSISWFKNGQQLTHTEGYRISHVAEGNDITVSTIRVKLIRSTEYGDYYCRATNKMGHAEARVHLYESVIQVIL